jgi:hypothetical protein
MGAAGAAGVEMAGEASAVSGTVFCSTGSSFGKRGVPSMFKI